VTLLRSPWGNAVAEDVSGLMLPAGPLMQLAPSEPLSNVVTLPASTFTLLGETDAPAQLRVFADAGQSLLLGTLAANGDGTWPRTTLMNANVDTVYVTALDTAGNESAPVPIETVELVATANRRRSRRAPTPCSPRPSPWCRSTRSPP